MSGGLRKQNISLELEENDPLSASIISINFL
jgi:hypothetical protein